MNTAHLFSNGRRLSPAEESREALVALDNRRRYVEQSSATKVNAPAPLPPRKPSYAVSWAEPAA